MWFSLCLPHWEFVKLLGYVSCNTFFFLFFLYIKFMKITALISWNISLSFVVSILLVHWIIWCYPRISGASLMAQTVKDLPAMQKTWVWSLGWEDSGEGNGYTLQYSCLENSMDKGVQWATVLGVTKSQIWLSDFSLSEWVLRVSEPLFIF